LRRSPGSKTTFTGRWEHPTPVGELEINATKTVHIAAAPEQVFSFMLDSTATPKGMTMEAVYESSDVVGSSYEWTFKMLGIPRKGVTVYTDYVPGERLSSRNLGAMEGTSTVTVEPDDGGSKVTYEMDSSSQSLWSAASSTPSCRRGGSRTSSGASKRWRSRRRARRQPGSCDEGVDRRLLGSTAQAPIWAVTSHFVCSDNG
jgi:hypothetical protein